MTELQKFDSHKERLDIFDRDGWLCLVCGNPIMQHGNPQVAHRLANTKTNRIVYGDEVVDHALNKMSVCCGECNDRVNIGFKTMQANDLAQTIKYQIELDKIRKDEWW